MGTDQRPSDPALTSPLPSRPQACELFQAISLLERAQPRGAALGHGSGRGETVRLSAQVALGFAPGDVTSVEAVWPGDPAEAGPTGSGVPAGWRLGTPLLSLAGADGPLPLSDTELLTQRRASRDRAPLDFLDIWHHRWLSLLYRSRKKNHLGLQWNAPTEGPVARTLDALSALGLAEGARGPGGERAWLRHAALLGPAPRSMAQLEALLQDRLGLRVRGRQFVGGWQALEADETPRLGRGSTLGRTVLGRRAWDAGAGISLEIGPVPGARWTALLPGGADLGLVQWLVGRHAQQDLQVQVLLHAEADAAAPPARLGQARLGWTSWLARSAPAPASANPSAAPSATPCPAPPAPVRLRLGADRARAGL
ncbi:type VI secretion system protein ImpH [Sphaerotilus hippei]|uniref:Type VI secretion system protein ImpH n=1 Tax=Sphaerotilus hippei TaxID=744406 RepID=A0A318H771_9BURK|nr:type VI secretion system baseplate subunit TssG [Sphaerotilus hippei]PXW97475.1 type VI secretion system protein ImpH [Sphaerotilus hippei]